MHLTHKFLNDFKYKIIYYKIIIIIIIINFFFFLHMIWVNYKS